MKAVILATALVLTLAGCATPAGTGNVDDELRRLNAQEVDALLRNDVGALKRLWSDDFVVTNPFNRFIDKQQVVTMTESGTLAFSAYERTVEYVRTYGDLAVVVGSERVVWAGKLPTAGQTSNLRFTAVWARQDGAWREVARHASFVAR